MKLKIDKKKLRKISPTENPFLSLANSIIGQQISIKAGNAIRAKFLLLFGRKKVTPENFLKLKTAELRGAGISPQKLGYLTDLAQKFVDKTIDHKNLHKGCWALDCRYVSHICTQPTRYFTVRGFGYEKRFSKSFQTKVAPV